MGTAVPKEVTLYGGKSPGFEKAGLKIPVLLVSSVSRLGSCSRAVIAFHRRVRVNV